MEQIKNESNSLCKLLNYYKDNVKQLQKYPTNKFYKNKTKEISIKIHKSRKLMIIYVKQTSLDFSKIDKLIIKLLDNSTSNIRKIEILDDLELKWQDFFIDMEEIKISKEIFTIPLEIPYTDIRLDLEEGIRDYQNGCYLSSTVMCRRAYEGALIFKYKRLEKKDPIKKLICKNCKNIVRDKQYFGLVELHKWAIENKLISDKFRNVGFLVPNLGAGGAHPSESFPRDSEMANIIITTTISLLKQIYKK